MATETITTEMTDGENNTGVIDDAELLRSVEAILFAAGHPVKYEKLSAVLGIPEYEVRSLVERAMPLYNDEDSPRGIMLLSFDDACQLCTKEPYAPLIREALGIRRGGNLSASSLEVLAIIAYNQPCTRAYVDMVRGVDSGYSVSSLAEKGLIEQRGRLDVPGRPILYGTTDTFLRVFGISSVDELPAVSKTEEKQLEIGETVSTDELL